MEAPARTRHARELFAPLGPTYDRYARVLSLGQDPRWRSFLVSRIPPDARRVLDVATGTAAVAIELAHAESARAVVGVDQSPEMLTAGRERVERAGLRERIELRETEAPAGIEEAEAAAAALAEMLQPEPRVASSAYLDAIGSASRRLEQALGESGASPFAAAMQSALGSVEELTADVERNHKVPLT